MTEELFQQLLQQFTHYIETYQSQDETIQFHMDMKFEHTQKVIFHSAALTASLGLTDPEQILCRAVALLHDLGRFAQFTRYRTFNDSVSVNHATLGLEELERLGWLEVLPTAQRESIQLAIANHNAVKIDPTLTPQQKIYAMVIRDADKLDIFRVLEPMLEPATEAGCSSALLANVLAGKQSLYSDMKTPDDRKILRLSWIYDINFSWTMQKLIAANYVNKVFDYLPRTPEIIELQNKLAVYMRRKAEKPDLL